MPSFSKPEQAPVNRRRFLAGTAAITAAACIPAAAGDGVALNSIAHPARARIAVHQLWIGDIVAVSPNTGMVFRVNDMADVANAAAADPPWPLGVAQSNCDAWGETQVSFGDDPMLAEANIIDAEITIEDQHDSARQNANGLRIAHRRRLDRAAAAVLQV